MHWIKDFVGDFDINDWFGFIYLIENIETDQKYIGQKQFRNRRRKLITGRKNRKVIIKESNWSIYTSSSDHVNLLIEELGKEKFRFFILKLCKTKRELGYAEVEEQIKRDVLRSKLPNGEREYYNKSIMNRWFACDKHSEESIEKIRLASTNRKHTDLTRKKMSTTRIERGLSKGENNPTFGKPSWNKGISHTEEMRCKISLASKGKTKSIEHRHKMSIGAKSRDNTTNSCNRSVVCENCGKNFNVGNLAQHKKRGCTP